MRYWTAVNEKRSELREESEEKNDQRSGSI